jgi:hypothetical protein
MALRGNIHCRRDLIPSEEINQGGQKMAKDHSNGSHMKRRGGMPLLVAIAIAVGGVGSMLIVDYGPWSKPQVQTAAMAKYTTTGEAARAAGATVRATEPKPELEPVPPGPKPLQPPNPTP